MDSKDDGEKPSGPMLNFGRVINKQPEGRVQHFTLRTDDAEETLLRLDSSVAPERVRCFVSCKSYPP